MPKGPEIPIVLFSVLSRDVDRKRAFAAGASEYLVKADDIGRLADTVERLLYNPEPAYKIASQAAFSDAKSKMRLRL